MGPDLPILGSRIGKLRLEPLDFFSFHFFLSFSIFFFDSLFSLFKVRKPPLVNLIVVLIINYPDCFSAFVYLVNKHERVKMHAP